MSDKKGIKTRQVVTAHPSSLKHSNLNSVENLSFWNKFKRRWPVYFAGLITICWISFCVYIAKNSGINLASMPLMELSAILSGVMLPLVLIWILCLVLIRVNPIEENYRALETGLDQLLNPVEITRTRIVKIIDNLKTEIDKIDKAGDVAANRFQKLQEDFKKQISELFDATIDADARSSQIREKLSGEREAISTLTSDIQKQTEQLTVQFKQFREDVQQTSDDTKKHSEFLNNELSFQNKTLENRSKQIEENLEGLGKRLAKISDDITDQSNHSYHHLSEVIDGFDERRAVLNNFMTTLMDEVGSICEKLDKQANTLNDFSGKSSKTSEKITREIKTQAEELSRIAEKTLKDISASGAAIEKQTRFMGTSIDEATENSKISIARASDYFTEKANDLNRVSSDLEDSIKQNLDEISNILTDKALSLGDDISIQFQNIEADLERGNEAISDILARNINKLSGHIENSKAETEKYLQEILSSIEEQSDYIGKSLGETRADIVDRTTLLQTEHQALEKYAASFQERMVRTENELKKQQVDMLSCITVIEDGLAVSIDKIKKSSTNLGAHGQQVIESIISQTSELTNQITEVQNRSKNSITEIQNASLKATDNILNREKETTEIIEEWLLTANNVSIEHNESMKKIESIMGELSKLEKATENTLSTSEENIRRISSELLRSTDSIQIASNSAIEALDETNRALNKNAEKYQQMINAIQLSSQSLALNANAIETKLKKINSVNFAHVSARIMEKLQSESIDIIYYLDGSIPKELWDNYLDGDKNLFIRKFKKYISKQAVSDIKNHYIENSEFRKNVDSFIYTFEELLATFNESTETVFKETLITSDISKVYFALAEATGRLKHND
ncbi:MAG: hypothetical protein R3D86_02420 [Emcibacteraceae bacterium]